MKNSSENFNQLFETITTIKVSSHATVNFIGEHTDYTGGYVMSSILPFKVQIFLNENKNKNYSIFSEYFDENFEFNDFIKSKSNNWLDYIKGCLLIFLNENKIIKNIYIKIFIKSDIPIARGVSSYAALCVGITKGLDIFFKIELDDKHIAILAQKVEGDYIGLSFGIMDQIVSSMGVHGKLFFLDCLSLKYELIDIPSDWIFCLIESEVQKNQGGDFYNERYSELKKLKQF